MTVSNKEIYVVIPLVIIRVVCLSYVHVYDKEVGIDGSDILYTGISHKEIDLNRRIHSDVGESRRKKSDGI